MKIDHHVLNLCGEALAQVMLDSLRDEPKKKRRRAPGEDRMKTQNTWSALIAGAVCIIAGALLVALTESQAIGSLLVSTGIGIIAVAPARVVDENNNGLADGTTNPPPAPTPKAKP